MKKLINIKKFVNISISWKYYVCQPKFDDIFKSESGFERLS